MTRRVILRTARERSETSRDGWGFRGERPSIDRSIDWHSPTSDVDRRRAAGVGAARLDSCSRNVGAASGRVEGADLVGGDDLREDGVRARLVEVAAVLGLRV